MSHEVRLTVIPDYYEVLQVHPKASPLMIKKAYRTLLMAGAHPDLGGTEHDSKLLTEAYEVLGDPERRRAYDRKRQTDTSAPASILVSVCPHCGVFNRVHSETKLLVARCGKCGRSIGKPKLSPLEGLPRWPWKAIAGAGVALVFACGLGATAFYALKQHSDPLQEAIDLEERGQLSLASERLQALLLADPRNALAHEHLGEVLEEEKKPDLAIQQYQQTIALSPSSARVRLLLGKALLREGKLAAAEAALRQAIQRDPEAIASLVALANLLVRTERADEAVGLYRRAVALDPRNSDLYYNLGTVFQLQGNTDQAIQTYRQALTIDPRHRDAMLHLGKLFEENGAWQDALTQYQRAAVLGYADPELHVSMALVLRKQGDTSHALRELQVAENQAKDNPILLARIQEALRSLGAG